MKRSCLYVLGFLFVLTMGLPAQEIFEFTRKRMQRKTVQVPKKVLAFYYTWYGLPENHGRYIHWDRVDPKNRFIADSTHYPINGPYDSQDPELIKGHIRSAKEAGLDGFICTWWGQDLFEDKAFEKVLRIAEEQNFSCTIYWETAPFQGELQVKKAKEDLLYVLNRYGSSPAFLKVDKKPVIFVYGRVMNQVSLAQWRKIILQTEKEVKQEFLLIADGYDPAYARIFDGIHTYNICSWVADCSEEELSGKCAAEFENDVNLARVYGKISCLTVIPGYDDTKIRTPGILAKRRNGVTYKTIWKEAVAQDPDWILITSWNEWHEGSEIESSFEHQDAYLKITNEYAIPFKQRPPTTLKPKRKKGYVGLEKLYKDRVVALLPEFSSEGVFYLAGRKIQTRELTWEEVTDPERFNPKRYPITIYGGYESYRQTVHKKGDVDSGILRYLKEGGLLMALARGPFPFFYNEKKEAVVSAPKFGFNIKNAWETPPKGLKPKFIWEQEKISWPFPKTSDLRWRPIYPPEQKGARYIPLIRLESHEGKWLGDAAAYSEIPNGGKTLYAWMGCFTGRKKNQVLFHLFKFAAEKSL